MHPNFFFTSAAPGAAFSPYILQGTGEPVMGGDYADDTRHDGWMSDSHST
ncbi:hypothetical protein ACPPVV_02565 [Rhodanobacter sp. Col0626]